MRILYNIMALAQNLSESTLIESLINQISSLTLFIQAIGGLIILYVIFNVISLILNRKNNKRIEEINNNLVEIKKELSYKNRLLRGSNLRSNKELRK